MTDSTNLIRIIQQVQPDGSYNLAAQSHVSVSFESPEYTADTDALGGKYEHIVNIVQENSHYWKDEYLEWIKIDELFGLSAEKIGERICR